MTKYKFLVAVDYDKNGRHYEAGAVDALTGWRKADVKAAVKANLIERTEQSKTVTATTAASTGQQNSSSVVSFDTVAGLQMSETEEAGGGKTWQQDRP